jgi:hypothetical protein
MEQFLTPFAEQANPKDKFHTICRILVLTLKKTAWKI